MYPGYVISNQKFDKKDVRIIQARLNELGCGPLPLSGTYSAATEAAVRQFQSRSLDVAGRALKIDGKVGQLTWGALFGPDDIPAAAESSAVAREALRIAGTQLHVREDPLGSNRGTEIDAFLRAVGLDPKKGSYPWCVAFAYWCYAEGAAALSTDNPLPATPGVLDHWNKAKKISRAKRISANAVVKDPSLISPGMLFVIDTGGGEGHMGIVESVSGGLLTTIEGNTNDGGTRDGIGVFRRAGARSVASINVGYISYADPAF